MTKTLFIPVKTEYFEAIKSGEKVEEYRLVTDFWRKRLDSRSYDRVVITKGYPKRDDKSRRIVKKWLGCVLKTITHPHFGEHEVEVYAIQLGDIEGV